VRKPTSCPKNQPSKNAGTIHFIFERRFEGSKKLLAQHFGEFLNQLKEVRQLIGRKILCKPPFEELAPQADLIWPGGPSNQTNVVNQHRLVTFCCCDRINFSAD
jgi:hypothetical protein